MSRRGKQLRSERRRRPSHYDPYWRCEVKECSGCGNKRPLTEYYSGIARCKKCHNVPRGTKRERAAKRRRYARRNPEKVRLWQQRVRAKPEWRLKNKLRRIAKEEAEGISDARKRARTSAGKLRQIAAHLRRVYKLHISGVDLIAYVEARPELGWSEKFQAWVDSGFERGLSPTLTAAPPIRCVTELRCMTYLEVQREAVRRRDVGRKNTGPANSDSTTCVCASSESGDSEQVSGIRDNGEEAESSEGELAAG